MLTPVIYTSGVLFAFASNFYESIGLLQLRVTKVSVQNRR